MTGPKWACWMKRIQIYKEKRMQIMTYTSSLVCLVIYHQIGAGLKRIRAGCFKLWIELGLRAIGLKASHAFLFFLNYIGPMGTL